MKFFKNKIFVIVLIAIISLFMMQFFSVFNSYQRDVNSYVTLIKGFGTVSTGSGKSILKISQKTQVFPGDVINTLSNSLAVIEWGDKSITRLAGSSRIEIKENFVSQDLSQIKISFELLKGKTWSNVITIMGEDSHFNEEMKGSIAAVRGTIFQSDYENDYVAVQDHELTIFNEVGDKAVIKENEAFSISNFKLEDIKKIIDETWVKLNNDLDKEYFDTLREEFLKQLKSNNPFSKDSKIINMISSGEDIAKINKYFSSLSDENKDLVLNKLKTLNQVINFEKGDNNDLYNLKLVTKNLLVNNVDDNNYKQDLIKYSLYDLGNIINNSNINKEVLQNTLNFIGDNKKYIDYSSDKFINFKENFKNIIDNFKDYNFDELLNKFKDINSVGKDFIDKNLNNLFNK